MNMWPDSQVVKAVVCKTIIVGSTPSQASMNYVYVLYSTVKENWIYIGKTKDLRKRFNEHNGGRVKSTKAYKPLILVYYEAYYSSKDASKREIELKKHSNKEKLKEQIKYSIENIKVCHASQDL